MVYQTGQHSAPDATYVQPAPGRPKKKRKVGMLIATGVVIVLTLGLIGAFAYAKSRAPGAQGGAAPAAARQPAAVSCEHGTLPNGACAQATESYKVPVVTDFELTLKITKKECFGSAGCNVGFETLLNYLGTGAEPNSSWDITYDITGAEDPYTNTMTTTFGDDGVHGKYEHEDGEMLQTPKSSSKLVVSVTSVTRA